MRRGKLEYVVAMKKLEKRRDWKEDEIMDSSPSWHGGIPVPEMSVSA